MFNAVTAIKNGRRVAEVLLASGADVKAREKNGFTALYRAVWGGDTEMVKLLLAHQAEINSPDNRSKTPF